MSNVKEKATELMFKEVVNLHYLVSEGWGDGIFPRDSLEQHVGKIRTKLESYVQIGLFSQEEMNRYWTLVNQARFILGVRVEMHNLSSTRNPTDVAMDDLIYAVEKFRYPKDGMIIVKEDI